MRVLELERKNVKLENDGRLKDEKINDLERKFSESQKEVDVLKSQIAKLKQQSRQKDLTIQQYQQAVCVFRCIFLCLFLFVLGG